jgi:hypothetical protein
MKNHALQCIENYNNKLEESPQVVYSGYIGIVNEYIIHHLDTIKNNDYKKITISKMKNYLISGVQCITHVFNMLMLYTKNLHLTLYHSQRAFYFYVEFMEQMSDDMHTFLQLTPKDACLFVYKKTIYEVNNDYRTNYNIEETLEEKIIASVITFYSGQVLQLINENDDIIEIIKLLNNDLHKLIQVLNKLYHKIEASCFYEKIISLNEYCYSNKITNNNYKPLEKYMKTMKKN